MKIRTDFVTNSSSSSYIVCFARIEDEEKAKLILDLHGTRLEVYTAEEALDQISHSRYGWSNWLEADWAGVDITPTANYIEQHKSSRFVVHEHCEDIYPDEDGYADYDVYYDDFDTRVIDDITEENGFADIVCDYGAGRSG